MFAPFPTLALIRFPDLEKKEIRRKNKTNSIESKFIILCLQRIFLLGTVLLMLGVLSNQYVIAFHYNFLFAVRIPHLNVAEESNTHWII